MPINAYGCIMCYVYRYCKIHFVKNKKHILDKYVFMICLQLTTLFNQTIIADKLVFGNMYI